MRCKHCKDKFIPKQFLQKYCMEKDECISEFLKGMRSKNAKEVKKKEAVEKKKTLDQLKTRSQWLEDLEYWFNRFIRLRDADLPCISCGTVEFVKYDAGHFWPAGNYSFLRFHEDNVHKQCSNFCNKNKHGNLGEYRPRLINKIGLERVTWLDENRHKDLDLTIEDIKEKIIYYKQKCREYEN